MLRPLRLARRSSRLFCRRLQLRIRFVMTAISIFGRCGCGESNFENGWVRSGGAVGDSYHHVGAPSCEGALQPSKFQSTRAAITGLATRLGGPDIGRYRFPLWVDAVEKVGPPIGVMLSGDFDPAETSPAVGFCGRSIGSSIDVLCGISRAWLCLDALGFRLWQGLARITSGVMCCRQARATALRKCRPFCWLLARTFCYWS
jgi:hypothetical protein